MANECNNLAILLEDLNQNKEAEKLLRESLETYRKLARNNPDAYELDVAEVSNNLVSLLRKQNKNKKEADRLFQEAMEIYFRRSKHSIPDT